MTVPFGDLARHTDAIREELDAASGRVLSSGRFLFGAELEAFEHAFAGWCGAAHATGVANGTDAITIALQAVGVEAGDEVITVANTCVPTVVGIENLGAKVVLVDAEERSRTIDPSRVEAAITERTKAIVPVHLYGQCADLGALADIAERSGLALVEDCAQAHGAEFEGQRAGSVGDAAAFSFYPTKNLGALGDGGAVVTNDASVAEKARLLRNYGERERFEHVLRGRNSRLDELQAAFLSEKLSHLDRWTERRREIARRYSGALQGTQIAGPLELPGRRHGYHLYVVETTDRETFRRHLAAAGVETAVHYPRAIHQQPPYRTLGAGRDLSVSERLASQVVSLPLYPELTDDEVELVCGALRESPSPSPAPG
ncbi:MAG: DegT/DnrJ/EryC1/StrS family aminotransferase [Gaiellaceae bacterium]